MSGSRRISKAFQGALCLPLDHHSRYILMSDCHRGTGNANDNFLKNEFLYLAALRHYFQNGFTYLELGDGDELWENRSLRRIREIHPQSFDLMEQYRSENRMYAIYGNHDIIRRKEPSFYSGIVLRDTEQKKDIYLTHGHQSDLLNSTFWPLSRFLVRYFWKPLEGLGIPDPTSAAKNNTKKEKSERLLAGWAQEHGCLLVTGHTHHPMIGTKDSSYCNTGSCIHPSGITGIEIEHRCMALVKWSVGTAKDMSLYVRREVLGDTVCIDEYTDT